MVGVLAAGTNPSPVAGAAQMPIFLLVVSVFMVAIAFTFAISGEARNGWAFLIVGLTLLAVSISLLRLH